MAEDYFDIVNERDEPIGRALRDEVHARGLRHRAVLIFVFNAAGQIFLQKRSMTKDVSPGLWTVSCSGHVDAGEEYDIAAQRELGEELGLKQPSPPARWFRVEACAATDWEFSWMYRTTAEGPFSLHPEEIETGQWIEREKLERWLLERPQNFCPGVSLDLDTGKSTGVGCVHHCVHHCGRHFRRSTGVSPVMEMRPFHLK